MRHEAERNWEAGSSAAVLPTLGQRKSGSDGQTALRVVVSNDSRFITAFR